MKREPIGLRMELNSHLSPPHSPEENMDKHTQSIEFSNSCRKFYISRLKATESFKKQLNEENKYKKESTKQKTTIDAAMDTLKNEMASLMDQDLSLMKQLLTLNETIEDLKANRKCTHSKDSLSPSTHNVNTSDWSVSETDMYSPDEEPIQKHLPTILVSKSCEQKTIEHRPQLFTQISTDSKKDTKESPNKPVPKSKIPTPQKSLTRTPSNSSQRSETPRTSIPVFVKLRQVQHKKQDSIDSGYSGSIRKDIEATI